MGVKLGLSHKRKSIDWGCFRTGLWEKYLGPKFHNEELRNLYSSCTSRQIKSRKMRWAEHVASMGEERSVQGFGGSCKKRDHSKKWDVDGRMGSNSRLFGEGGGMEKCHLVQDRNRWWVLVNMVMNFSVLAEIEHKLTGWTWNVILNTRRWQP
jgi:hypothetical protein